MKPKHPKYNTPVWLFIVAGCWMFLLSNILRNGILAWLSIFCFLIAAVFNFCFILASCRKKNETDPS